MMANLHPHILYEIIVGKKRAAEILCREGAYNNSGYLAGYVLEVAYKLAIDLANANYPREHRYSTLFAHWRRAVALDPQLARHTLFDPNTSDHPAVLRHWTEITRYDPRWCETEAECQQIIVEIGVIMQAVNEMKADFLGRFQPL